VDLWYKTHTHTIRTPFRPTMPAKSKKSKSAVRDTQPTGSTKDYVNKRWTIDSNFGLRVLEKADDHATSGLFFSIYAGQITGMWFNIRSVNRVKTRLIIVTTNMGDKTTTDNLHEFNTHGLVLAPKCFKDFEVKEGKGTTAVLDTLAALAKIDKSCSGPFVDKRDTEKYKGLAGQDHLHTHIRLSPRRQHLRDRHMSPDRRLDSDVCTNDQQLRPQTTSYDCQSVAVRTRNRYTDLFFCIAKYIKQNYSVIFIGSFILCHDNASWMTLSHFGFFFTNK
jgi:hypothetical protein